MAGPDLDVTVVGDGPAGLALAAACRRTGLAVAVLGGGASWPATYSMWRDEVDLPDGCFRTVSPTVVVFGHRRHAIDRAYAIVDNDALRVHLSSGLDVRVGRAARVQHFTWGSRIVRADGGSIDAVHVIDATGRPPALAIGPASSAAQTAFGVVVPAPPSGYDDEAATMMDLRPPPDPGATPTFCYVVPVAGGWLVEETVLAARPPVDPDLLRRRLAGRFGAGGDDIVATSRLERVVIPIDGGVPPRRQAVVAFGAAAGYTHPATGYSVAASLRAAPRVAAALGTDRPDPARVWEAVWPPAMRRTRRLHDYGLEVLLRLGPHELATFFDTFFELPVETWAPYLRIDAAPGEVSRTMTGMLRRLPWSMRRRLVVDPRGGR